MTDTRRTLHVLLTITGALALSLALMAILAHPASAATTTITRSGGMFVGDPALKPDTPDALAVPAGSSTQGPSSSQPRAARTTCVPR